MNILLDIEWPTCRSVEANFELDNNEERHFLTSEHVRVDGHGRVHIRGIFGANNVVPDVQRYSWENEYGTQLRRHCDIQPDCLSHIVFLLESPHICEYRNSGIDIDFPCAPALGKTGENLDQYLCSLLKAIDAPTSEVIVSNPIQFQASLYAIHRNCNIGSSRRRSLTNAVWRALWRVEEIRSDFLERMRSYDPCVLVNACTTDLSATIDQFSWRRLSNVTYWKTTHPSSWKRQKIRFVWKMRSF